MTVNNPLFHIIFYRYHKIDDFWNMLLFYQTNDIFLMKSFQCNIPKQKKQKKKEMKDVSVL